MKTEHFTPEQTAQAAQVIRRGGLLAIPTETVYGLGANGLDADAVRRVFEAKGRPQDNPLILHVAGPDWLERYCKDIPPLAYTLAERFWPGPLTMILPRREIVPDVTTGGLDTVGMRCPDHPLTLAIIREAGVPIAAPSANTSGRPSPTTAAHVTEDMEGKIEGIMDGGDCSVGVESTILDLTCTLPRLLRPGGLPLEELEAVVGEIAVDKAVTGLLGEGEKPRAPGMKYRHYAPKAPVTVVTGEPWMTAAYILKNSDPSAGVICFNEFESLFSGRAVQTLGESQDKGEQARRVFDALRAFDATQVTEIFAQCPDPAGLGLAICNRLKKAAGFHVIALDGQDRGRMKIIGITGGTGAGKTTALNQLASLGALIIDCDATYHWLLEHSAPMLGELRARFPAAFDGAGRLDRKRLGAEVFHDPGALEELNRITHRYVRMDTDRRIAQAAAEGYPAVGIDAIALIESGIAARCDVLVGVVAPPEVRVKRIMEREGISQAYAQSRVDAQKPEEFFRAHCDYVLDNAQGSDGFLREARKLFGKLLET